MVKISLEDFEAAFFGTGPTGICTNCGKLVAHVELEAGVLRCETCEILAVFNIEVARKRGLVEIEK